jgi:AcrR family transcriptional regulator
MAPQPKDSGRERIREAMIDLCLELRYPNVTLPALLERANVDRAAFDADFADLEDCFCQIFAVHREEMTIAVGSAFAAAQGWREQMRAAAYAMLRFLGEDLRRARFMSVEVLYAGDRAKLMRDEAMQGFFLLIDLGRQEMDDPDALTPATAETIGSAIYQRIQSAFERDQLDRFELGVQEMMYTAVLPYLGPEAAAEELTIAPPPFPSR